MLQAYSSNATVATNAVYPLNNAILRKGCSVVLSGPSTIQLNQRGVYLVECDGYCTPTEAGDVEVQLYINDVARPEAISSFTGALTEADTFGFKTFVQVNQNNSNCCYSSPTVLQFFNNGVPVEDAHINICVTKVC